MRLPRSLEKFFWINSLEELKSDKLAIIWRCIQTEIKCLVYYPFCNCNKVERRDAITTKGWWFLRWEIETPGARPPAKSMVAATKEKVDLNWFNVQSALILGCLEDFLGKVSWFQISKPEDAPRLTSLSSAVQQIWRKSGLQSDAKTQRPWSWPRPSFWKAGTQYTRAEFKSETLL